MPISNGAPFGPVVLTLRAGFHPGKDSLGSPGTNQRAGLLADLFTQSQADRQGVAQGLALLGGFQLVIFAHRAQDGLVGAELAQPGEDSARNASSISRRGRWRLVPVVRGRRWLRRLAAGRELAIEQGVDPALGGLPADDGIGESIEGHASAEPAEAPEHVTRRGRRRPAP